MKISELLDRGITRVRKPDWHEVAFLSVHPCGHGYLYDPFTQDKHKKTTPEFVQFYDDEDTDWEKYEVKWGCFQK